MDIERLSKAQIILLTLLVSFVTSIATGIVTVSLMEQAPPAIAQTVNRVVERTVEKVVPATSQAAAVVTTEKTVVVKESDLIAKAVADAMPSVVRLFKQENAGDGTPKDIFVGLGVVLSADGSIAAEAVPAVESAGGSVAVLSDGTRVWASFVSKSEDYGLMALRGATTTDSGTVPWKPIAIDAGVPVLGESVFAISGKSAARITDGIVTSLPAQDGARVVETSVSADILVSGSPLVSIDGGLIGLSTSASRAISGSTFVLAAALQKPAESEKKNTP